VDPEAVLEAVEKRKFFPILRPSSPWPVTVPTELPCGTTSCRMRNSSGVRWQLMYMACSLRARLQIGGDKRAHTQIRCANYLKN
jgi:hypothetical protein